MLRHAAGACSWTEVARDEFDAAAAKPARPAAARRRRRAEPQASRAHRARYRRTRSRGHAGRARRARACGWLGDGGAPRRAPARAAWHATIALAAVPLLGVGRFVAGSSRRRRSPTPASSPAGRRGRHSCRAGPDGRHDRAAPPAPAAAPPSPRPSRPPHRPPPPPPPTPSPRRSPRRRRSPEAEGPTHGRRQRSAHRRAGRHRWRPPPPVAAPAPAPAPVAGCVADPCDPRRAPPPAPAARPGRAAGARSRASAASSRSRSRSSRRRRSRQSHPITPRQLAKCEAARETPRRHRGHVPDRRHRQGREEPAVDRASRTRRSPAAS